MSIIFEKWLWIIIVSVFLIIVGPLIVIWLIINLPTDIRVLATICIIILWGVVSGYKDWILSKEKNKLKQSGEKA
ncbi:MAG: hypothetical protein QXX08_07955 [Candidatus Bathyarchaeia archaeon]